MEKHVARLFQQAAQTGVERDQIEISLAWDEDLGPVAFEPLDQVLAQKAGAAGNGDTFSCPGALHQLMPLLYVGERALKFDQTSGPDELGDATIEIDRRL